MVLYILFTALDYLEHKRCIRRLFLSIQIQPLKAITCHLRCSGDSSMGLTDVIYGDPLPSGLAATGQ